MIKTHISTLHDIFIITTIMTLLVGAKSIFNEVVFKCHTSSGRFSSSPLLSRNQNIPTTSRISAFGFTTKNTRSKRTPTNSKLNFFKSNHISRRGQMLMWGEENKNNFNDERSNRIPKGGQSSFVGVPMKKKDERNISMDQSGRTMRRRSPTRSDDGVKNSDNSFNDDNWGDNNNGGNRSKRGRASDNFDDWGAIRSSKSDDYDDFSIDIGGGDGSYYEPYEYTKQGSKNRRSSSGGGEGRGRGRGGRGERNSGRGGRGRGGGRSRGGNGDRYDSFESGLRMKRQIERSEESSDPKERKINLRALEGAGFVHLYGLAPVINALKAKRRDFTNLESVVDLESLEGEELEHELKQRERKPEAQFTPWLFAQDNMKDGSSGKTGDKAAAATEVEVLAKSMDIPIAYVDKGILNALCGNRPHQGFVLRCGNIEFAQKSLIPHPDDDESPLMWLCLDEVVDPQNFGALLRSAYFLGSGMGKSNKKRGVGIMVCSKNSAPPTPVVSAASAGALELCEVYSTSNLPRTLSTAKENGWRILGAAASAPIGMVDEITGQEVVCQDLDEVEVDDSKPTILVLGSEGHGLRKLVARACSGFVRIPGSVVPNSDDESQAGVDSLNVSVTGGIMLWHFLSSNK